jgi:hypothetical protein
MTRLMAMLAGGPDIFGCPIHARRRGSHGQVFVRGVVERMGGVALGKLLGHAQIQTTQR